MDKKRKNKILEMALDDARPSLGQAWANPNTNPITDSLMKAGQGRAEEMAEALFEQQKRMQAFEAAKAYLGEDAKLMEVILTAKELYKFMFDEW